MTEHVTEATPDRSADELGDDVGGEPLVRTGIAEVDGVLADVEGLGDVPLDQHMETFERAHQTLKDALDGRTSSDAQA